MPLEATSPEQAAAIARELTRRRRDNPAEQLARRAHFHKRLGIAAPRRRIPMQLRPEMIEIEYGKDLEGLIDLIEQELQPLIGQLPEIIAAAQHELGIPLEDRADAGQAQRVRDMIARARTRMQHWMADARMRSIIERTGEKASTFQRAQLARQLRAALGIDALILDRKLRTRIAGFVEENMAYITDLSESVIGGVEKLIFRALTTGQNASELATSIAKRFNVGKARARSIADDQVNKLVGQLNMDRQLELGITHYFWRTRRDPKVRPEHRRREGKRYAWVGKGKAAYIPGEEYGCRCYAEPDFHGVLEHWAAITKLTVPPRRPEARPGRKQRAR